LPNYFNVAHLYLENKTQYRTKELLSKVTGRKLFTVAQWPYRDTSIKFAGDIETLARRINFSWKFPRYMVNYLA